MKNKVTFKDVAQLAGVSTQTVSRVTNNNGYVNEKTRAKVQAAIDKLGYVPNKSAQLMGRKKADVFGVITLDISFQGASRIVEGIRNESKKAGYAISLAVLDDEPDALENAVRDMKSQQVNAVLINAPVSREQAEQLVHKHAPLPFIFIDAPPDSQVDHVMTDHSAGGRIAAQLMIQQGRTRFAFLNGPEHSPAARLRRAAWLTVINESGATLIAEETGDWSARSGYQAGSALIAGGQAFDALLIANDQMALGALRACREHRIDVPRQTAVIGFDDTANSEFFCPPLTTIRQNFLEIGHQAVTEVLACMKDPEKEAVRVDVPVELIERQSTAPAESPADKAARLESLLSELKQVL
ncbi:LacI family DNA-binding transcriptional regulator [Pontiella agarivorans]|uniref:LacI family DNA-binding transcriptional regulator n=1 Tax=Pontiella agarivorans TaxID=3038953 RepID=A0ABU5MWE4_9BACT|nr:LacI family DNA-binding transcriptional regulator [Pontiella agarivorans]MDZ8118514.1 LacI family DNA-binding transcriptional regulator [Pontiella agarivorans]